MRTTCQLANEAASYFATAKRPDGEAFVRLKDGRPDWALELVRAAHGDMLPNDWRYQTIWEALEALAEAADADDARAEFADAVDVYNGQLLAWLGSHSGRPAYCDEAAAEFGHSDGIVSQIMAGQMLERGEVFDLVAAFLTDKAESEAS